MEYTPSDYLEAVNRELQKRETTYPKIIKKKEKSGMPPQEIFEEIVVQQRQVTVLQNIKAVLKYDVDINHIGATLAAQMMAELKREMKMRKRYYPRLIYFKRITEETAEYEKAVWESLIRYFDEKYYSIYKLLPA